MTREQLHEERKAAGKAYADAIASLQDAWIRLASVERTLRNSNVKGGEFRTFHFTRHALGEALRSLQHSEFVPRILVSDWHEPVTVKSDRQILDFNR